MPPPPKPDSIAWLVANAGLTLTAEQMDDLATVHEALAAMKDRVRKPRGHMAEPALTFGFTAEDL